MWCFIPCFHSKLTHCGKSNSLVGDNKRIEPLLHAFYGNSIAFAVAHPGTVMGSPPRELHTITNLEHTF